ncbi:MAG: gliding motility-associated C-terminal domain-containing protein [Ginsengibacter sp.]
MEKKTVATTDQLILYITSTDATCGYASGSMIVQVANGIPPYTYTISANGFTNPPQNTGNFPVVAAGVNTITVTDSKGTKASTDVVIKNVSPGPIVVPAYLTKNPSDCFKADGVVTLKPYGGTPPYTYSLDLVNFQTSNVFSNLNAGIYQFYVKDAKGCIGINSFFVSNASCDPLGYSAGGYVCEKDGTLSVKDLAGQGTYQYSMDSVNYQSSGDFSNIGAGIHRVFIKNNAGVVQILGVNYAENCALNLQYIEVDAACEKNDGSMTIMGANGTPPYSYSIDGVNYQSSNVFTNLAQGNYYVTVKDAIGEKSSLEATVYNKCPVVRAVVTSESCSKNDGTITAGGFKGTQPYQYSIDGINFQVNNEFTNLPAGVYTVTLKDAFGFIDTTHVTVPYSCLNLSSIENNSTCGKSNGSLLVTASNGTPPYSYSIDGIHYQNDSAFNGLVAGNYVITVKDVTGAYDTLSTTVYNIAGAAISTNVTAATCTNNDGAISASNVGGTPPFQFSDDGVKYQVSGKFSGLDTGVIKIYIRDSNGCVNSKTVTVPLNDNLKVDAGKDITICEGEGQNISATTNGSSYSWSPALGLNNNMILNPEASPVVTTTYYLSASGGICTQMDSVNVIVNSAPIADAGGDLTICAGKSVSLNGSGGSQFEWSPPTYLSDPRIANPIVNQPGSTITYNLVVTDAKGCKSLTPSEVIVTVTPPPLVFAGNDTSILINQSLQLNAVDVKGSGFTNYTWSPSSGLDDPYVKNPIALVTKDITYKVTASTSGGCVGIDTISIKVFKFSDILVPNAFTPNNDGLNDILKAIPIGIKEFLYFTVYNQWGQKVFSTTNPLKGWDGTFESKAQDSGIYLWICEGLDYYGKLIKHKGIVMLIR